MKRNISGVMISSNEELTDEQASAYIDYVESKHKQRLRSLELNFDGEDVEIVGGSFETIPFERVRRITGYLVGTMDRWNEAKSQEEHDRVKHSIA